MTAPARSRLLFIATIAALAALMAATFGSLAARTRFGLEFRGGYELYYVATPAPHRGDLSDSDLVQAANILRQRADALGIAEPDVRIEGKNHIRVKLAGLTSASEARSLLGSGEGLPVTLTERYTQTVGSVLGKTALAETVTAGLVGIACIALLLIGLYRAMGLVAVFCTGFYLWLLLLFFNSSHATLSLSAVVAFVLGIGVAADASIICFERVREDLRRGLSSAAAVRLGFSQSFHTIRDANLVTALAMVALFIGGIGPIQGFSVTMLASIVTGVTANYFLARRLCLWLAEASWLPPGLLIGGGKARPVATATFDFARWGRVAIAAAALLIAAGGLYYKAHHLNLDIDFTAGTALDIDLDRAIAQDEATRIMTDAGTAPATVVIGGPLQNHIAARFDEVLKPQALQTVLSAFQTRYARVDYEENTADPGVARDFARRAIFAMALAFAGIALFIGWRFSAPVALATIVPIMADMAIVTAIFSLFKLEIDVTYIAALLTIAGYSLNDKIVIFGRIFENLRDAPGLAAADLPALVNRSIRQTLSRSLYTVLTVVLAAASLYHLACEPLQMFSLAIWIGLISGAFSSIFVASYLWLWLRLRGERAPAAIPPRLSARPLAVALGLILVGFTAGWVMVPAAGPLGASAARADQGKVRPLGDLSAFLTIARDTQAILESGDLSRARGRIKDLETAWDDAEEKLHPMNEAEWTAADKAIDRALRELRSKPPDAAACKGALTQLIAKLESLQAG